MNRKIKTWQIKADWLNITKLNPDVLTSTRGAAIPSFSHLISVNGLDSLSVQAATMLASKN